MADENEGLENGEGGEVDEAILKEARALGWRPQEEFRGDKTKWVDAATFVEKGQHVLPIINENNRRLKNDLLTAQQKIDTLEAANQESKKAIAALQKSTAAATQKAVEDAIRNTKQALKDAREDGDVDAELAAQERLLELNQAKKDAKNPPAATADEEDPGNKKSQLSPEFVAWQRENPWFGGDSKEDRKKTRQINVIAEDLRDEGETVTGVAFLDLCIAEYEKRNAPTGRAVSKVEGGGPRGSGGGSRESSGAGKKFSDLPKEARDACKQFSDTLVGPGKAYKTEAEWEAAYTKQYFEEG